jgi:GT2 family glycosyltransferase
VAPPSEQEVARPEPSTGTGAAPRVSVVVVNYNGADGLVECLTALAEDPSSPAAEILVVDNASEDGSLAIAEGIAQKQERVRVIESSTNRGYAGAVNLALPAARGEYVAVLNMDILVSPGWLGPLIGFLDANPESGAACPLIVLQDDPTRINAAGQDVHVTGLGFNRALGQPRESVGAEPFSVSGLHGAAFVIRRSILERLGGWDDRGFLYHEDVQLSWLLQLMGAEIRCVPGSTVQHDYHLTMSPEKLFLLERNRVAMLLSNLKLSSRLALSPLLGFTELLMWGYCLIRGPRFLRSKIASYRWVLGDRERIRARRRLVRSLRRRSDWEIVRGLRWGYPWDQFFTLGRERGESQRDRLNRA